MTKSLPQTTEMEKAYLAGILDGEGYVTITRQKTSGRFYYRANVQVSNTRFALLKWLKDRWGGQIFPDGHAYRNRRNNAMCWKWNLECLMAKKALQDALPYLVLKEEQALSVLAFPGRSRSGRGRAYRRSDADIAQSEQLWNRVSWLNQFGGKNAVWHRREVIEATTGDSEEDGGGIQEVRDGEGDGSVVA